MLMPLASGVQAAPVMTKMLETRRSHWGCFQALLFQERQEIPRKGQLQIEWASGTDGPARGLTDAFHIILNVLPILNGFTKGHRIRWLRRPQKIPPAGGLDHRSAARRRAGWRCGRGGAGRVRLWRGLLAGLQAAACWLGSAGRWGVTATLRCFLKRHEFLHEDSPRWE